LVPVARSGDHRPHDRCLVPRPLTRTTLVLA
jgi:hypothetical protein